MPIPLPVTNGAITVGKGLVVVADTGCAISPRCIDCQMPRCVYEDAPEDDAADVPPAALY